ncbi:hypothetical protein YC2023_045157 [Brassica napus]
MGRKLISRVFPHAVGQNPNKGRQEPNREEPSLKIGCDVPWGSAPGKTDMHGLIIGSSNDICSLFDSYLLNHEDSTHEITWRMFSTQLRSSSKKNQIKRSSYVIVMLFTNQVIFSSREFRPPEKLEMANLLSDEPTANSIMTKVIIHVLNVQESIGLDGFQKDSKTSLFGPNGETDKILAKGKDGFRPSLKGTCLGPYQEYILNLSKSWSFLVSHIQVNTPQTRWSCESYQATVRDSSFGGLGPAAGRAPHVVWCPVHSRQPLKIRRTECRSRPVVLITASGLQGEQPLGSRQNGSIISGKGLALRAGLGGPSSETVDCWWAA